MIFENFTTNSIIACGYSMGKIDFEYSNGFASQGSINTLDGKKAIMIKLNLENINYNALSWLNNDNKTIINKIKTFYNITSDNITSVNKTITHISYSFKNTTVVDQTFKELTNLWILQ